MATSNANSAATARPRQPGSLSLFEAMILVAGTAAGLGMGKGHRVGFSQPPQTVLEPLIPGWVFEEAGRLFMGALPAIAALAAAVLVLIVRRRSPELNGVFRQPGALACAIVLLCNASGVAIVLTALTVFEPYTRGWLDWVSVPSLISLLTYVAALPVALAWLVLLVRRRWRSEPGYLDVLGQALGWFLIAGFLFTRWLVLSPI